MSFQKVFGCLIIPAALLACSGCKSTYSEKRVSNEPVPVLKSTTRIYVGMPFDASFKEKVAYNSGRQVADAVSVAFSRNTKPVFTSRAPEGRPEALENARRFNAEYMVYPTILQWEDRATEWSGIRDKLQMRIDIIDVRSGEVIYAREIEAKGRWMTDGGDSPADLLKEPTENVVNSLFHRTEKPSALW